MNIMKTIEEKAKAYDEATKIIKANLDALNDITEMGEKVVNIQSMKNCFYRAFPELKESEDEQSKKWILEYLYDGLRKSDEQFKGQFKAAIDWFEKQGEQNLTKNIVETWKDMRLEVYQQASGNRHEPNYSDDTTKMFSLNDIDEIIEKMSEQKLVDNVEPKFKVGDWVINTITKEVEQVIELAGCEYICSGHLIVSFNNQHLLRLWTINDAKNGDVVANKSDGTIGIFQSIGHHPDGGSYNDTSYCFLHCRYDDGFFYADFENGNTIDADDLIPATKEQRDLLFKKMHEAGYEWDAEKKVLKKLAHQEVTKTSDQETSEWSEEDEKMRIKILEALSAYADHVQYTGCGHPELIRVELMGWLKSLKDRVLPQNTWKPSDEQIKAIRLARSFVTDDFADNPTLSEILMDLEEQLKKLKEE